MTPQQKLIARLCVVFGEPRTDDVALFVKELARSLKDFEADVLEKAGDEIIDGSQYWPRPYEIRSAAVRIAAAKRKAQTPVEATVELPPPTPEQCAKADEMLREMRKAAASRDVSEEIKPLPDLRRDGFEAMQRKSRNTWLHQLSPRSRAMSGDNE